MDGEGKPVGPSRCIELLRGFSSPSPESRDSWGSAPAWWDIEGEFDFIENCAVGEVMTWAASTEIRLNVRESLLGSLDSFAQGDLVPVDTVQRLADAIPPEKRHPSEVDYWETFEAKLAEHRDHPDRPTMQPAAISGPPHPPGTSVGPARCIELVRGLTHTDTSQRLLWSAAITSHTAMDELDDREAHTLATIIGWALLIEPDPDVRTGLLSSLAALARRSLVPTHTLTAVIDTVPPGDDPLAQRALTTLTAVLAA